MNEATTDESRAALAGRDSSELLGAEYDSELHDAWQARLLELAKEYRDADEGDEVRDAYRALRQHLDAAPASMALTDCEIRTGIELQRKQIERMRETLRGILDADWRKWEELASPEEFVRWAKARAQHALTPNAEVTGA